LVSGSIGGNVGQAGILDLWLGRIEIPKQNFLPPNQEYECEHMTFNPWNCLEQHRPLGSINRMRLKVYLASLQVRQKLNMVAS
jgi:hypothetical protein